jgi:hypothetical protein
MNENTINTILISLGITAAVILILLMLLVAYLEIFAKNV